MTEKNKFNPSLLNKKFSPSSITKMKVVRFNEMGAFLDAETGNTSDDILLHYNQQTKKISLGEIVEVFLYLDPKRRITASMKLPKIQLGEIDYLEVINVSKDGAFIDVGTERGIFMPFAEMRGRLKIGDKVLAKLYLDKSKRLALTMRIENDIRKIARHALDVRMHVGDKFTGVVFNYSDKGAFLFSKEKVVAFLDNHEMNETRPKVGEEISGRVTFIRENGHVSISLREKKEKAILSDSEKIFRVLLSRGGKMPYNDKTSPEILQEKFSMSKAAFKRALGSLLKQQKISMDEQGWIQLVK